MNQTQNRATELVTQQADAQVLLAPMMLLDDEVLKHVAGGGPVGNWGPASTQGPVGNW